MEDGKLLMEEVAAMLALADSHQAFDAMKTAKDRRFIYRASPERVVMDVLAKLYTRS
jgi:hypothetical protein